MRPSAPLALVLILVLASAPPASGAEGAPDLAVTSVGGDARELLEGESYRLVATVANVGDAPLTTPVEVAFTLDGAKVGSSTLDASAASPLAPGATIVVTFAKDVVSGGGVHYATAFVDAGGIVAEADETNNEWYGKLAVAELITQFAAPGGALPYAEVHKIYFPQRYVRVFSLLDCSGPSALVVVGHGGFGAYADECTAAGRFFTGTHELVSGEYNLTYTTVGGAGAKLFGVPN